MKKGGRQWWWLLVLIPVLLGLSRLRFDVEILSLLPDDVPVVQGLKAVQQHFAGGRELLITLDGQDADAVKSAAASLSDSLKSSGLQIPQIRWQSPWQEHPEDLSELVAVAWMNQPTQAVQELHQRLQPGRLPSQLQEVRQELQFSFSPERLAKLSFDPLDLTDVLQSGKNPFGNEAPFASPDGTFRIVHVTPPQLNGYRETDDWLSGVRSQVDQWQSQSETASSVSIAMTGAPVFLVEIATGMERDMTRSIAGTGLIVVLLFWIVHRRIRPLLWLVFLLVLVLIGTMAVGGYFPEGLNVVSIGFAAILLGLSADYALVLYQEARLHPDDPMEGRRKAGRGIVGSSVTTAAAFAVLSMGGLPGLAQLGWLVAAGILMAAALMLNAFLPPLVGGLHAQSNTANSSTATGGSKRSGTVFRLAPTLALAVIAVVLLGFRFPVLDRTADSLRPRQSEAYATMARIEEQLQTGGESIWLVANSSTDQSMANLLKKADKTLKQAQQEGVVASFSLPSHLWPHPARQMENLDPLKSLGTRAASVGETLTEAGFSGPSKGLAQSVLNRWAEMNEPMIPVRLSSDTGRWLMEQTSAEKAGQLYFAGSITRNRDQPLESLLEYFSNLDEEIADETSGHLWISGWPLLGPALVQHVGSRLSVILAAVLLVLVIFLTFTFRSLRQTAYSFAALAMTFLLLLAVMGALGMTWNLMNLLAIPLLLGATVDYSLHQQLSLQRNRGDLKLTWQGTGKAIFLCALTTITAFGSLSLSNNAGLSGLGAVCALGAACAMLVNLVLLPAWWRSNPPTPAGSTTRPSLFYNAFWWRASHQLISLMPTKTAHGMAVCLAGLYRWAAPARLETAQRNLLPFCDGQPQLAAAKARSLFRNFAVKLVDLWRYESGRDIVGLFHTLSGFEEVKRIAASPRGVLMVTVHLGNWEFGAPLLKRHGIDLTVLTAEEPGRQLTEMRRRAREQWGIETLVVGEDAFGFVEVIRRLQEGGAVALLMDRPHPAKAVHVDVSGHPLPVSLAPAELARASGCAVVPVVIVRDGNGYQAHMDAPMEYDRSGLGNRDSRIEFTSRLFQVFNPWIQRHPDQWYHFVPVWSSRPATAE